MLFIYPGNVDGEHPLGLLYLSSVLKKAGHETDLFHLTPYKTEQIIGKGLLSTSHMLKKVETFKPDIVGFSVSSSEYLLCLDWARKIKDKFDIPIIFGGPHPTVDPLGTLSEKHVDMICVGEGEEALVELLNAIENGKNITKIKNIWVKKNGHIYRNTLRPLIENIDALPYPDRDLIEIEYLNNKWNGASFMTSRGCPFQCSYCINHFLQKLYKNKGSYVRYRNVRNVIDEIKYVIEKYKIEKLTFIDETFSFNKKHIIELCKIYEKEVGLPFVCQTRANVVDKKIFLALKNAGCEIVHIGIESGNEFIRNSVMNRNMNEESILNAFKLAKEVGLRTSAYNMVGLPYETESMIWDTIKLNREAKPDETLCTILSPFKGTELEKVCRENKWIKNDISESYYTEMTHEIPTISCEDVISYQQLFQLYINLPEKYFPLINSLRKGLALTAKNKTTRRIVFQLNRILDPVIIKLLK